MHPDSFPLPTNISAPIAAISAFFTFELPFTLNTTASAYIGLFTLLAIIITSSLILSFLLFALPCILAALAYQHVLKPLARLAHRFFYRLFPQGPLQPLVPRAYDQVTMGWNMRLQERTKAFNRRGVVQPEVQEPQSPQSPTSPMSEESVLDAMMRAEPDYAERRMRLLEQRRRGGLRGELVYS